MQVCVVGLGYIGLPTAVVLAQCGAAVVGVDRDPRVRNEVAAGRLHFVEEGLGETLSRVVAEGRLRVSSAPVASEVFIVAVPTPFGEGRRPDLTYVESAVRDIAAVLEGGELIILESTSPPGTTESMKRWVTEERPDLDPDSVDFAHGPERVIPGRIMTELVQNDRIVGGLTERATRRACDVYRLFCSGEIHETDARTAETVKLVENSYRDVNIAFANELSLVADHLGIDVWEVIDLANRHPRVNILSPGPGVGGHCIAVDPWFLVDAAPEHTRLVRVARSVNDSKPAHVLELIERAELASGAKIALLGLAFKANVDDLRGSPATEIALAVRERYRDADVMAVEPHVESLPPDLERAGVRLVELSEALVADLVVLLVDHDDFADVPWRLPAGTSTIDTRGQWRRSSSGL